MARSTKIYVVYDPDLEAENTIVAAFTVKSEMEAWVKAQGGHSKEWEIVSVNDGLHQTSYDVRKVR